MSGGIKTVALAGGGESGEEYWAYERDAAIYDLTGEGDLTLPSAAPPLRLVLAYDQKRFRLNWQGHDGGEGSCILAPPGLLAAIAAYRRACAVYYRAVRGEGLAVLEELDRERRRLHEKGAGLVREGLAGSTMNDLTARRLFTLLAVLAGRGVKRAG